MERDIDKLFSLCGDKPDEEIIQSILNGDYTLVLKWSEEGKLLDWGYLD